MGEIVGLIIVMVIFAIMLWMGGVQDWLERRRFNKLPISEKKKVWEKKAENFKYNLEFTSNLQKELQELREKERSTWSDEKRKREERKARRKREKELQEERLADAIKKSQEWQSERKKVFGRQNNACSLCGKSLVGIGHVHHRIFRSKGGNDSLENLEGLCPSCHKSKHKKRS